MMLALSMQWLRIEASRILPVHLFSSFISFLFFFWGVSFFYFFVGFTFNSKRVLWKPKPVSSCGRRLRSPIIAPKTLFLIRLLCVPSESSWRWRPNSQRRPKKHSSMIISNSPSISTLKPLTWTLKAQIFLLTVLRPISNSTTSPVYTLSLCIYFYILIRALFINVY